MEIKLETNQLAFVGYTKRSYQFDVYCTASELPNQNIRVVVYSLTVKLLKLSASLQK